MAKETRMKVGRALDVVLKLADVGLYSTKSEMLNSKSETAMDVLADFVRLNDHGDSQQPTLDELGDALERHCAVEGTKAQLVATQGFLTLAFDIMDRAQQQEFLLDRRVAEFIAKNGGV